VKENKQGEKVRGAEKKRKKKSQEDLQLNN